MGEELREPEIDSSVCCEDFWECLFESITNSAKEVVNTGFYWFIEVPYGIASGLLNLFEIS